MVYSVNGAFGVACGGDAALGYLSHGDLGKCVHGRDDTGVGIEPAGEFEVAGIGFDKAFGPAADFLSGLSPSK